MFDQIKQLKIQAVHFYEHFDVYPLKRLCQLRYVLNTTFSVVGIGILDKNWKVNLLTIFKLIVTFIFVIFCMYTIWIYRDQSVLVLQVFCCQGVFLPNIIKLHIVTKCRRELCSYANFGEFLYESNEKVNLNNVETTSIFQRIDCMKKSIRQTYMFLLAMISAVNLAVMLFSLFPAYMWFIKHNYVWLLPVLVPYTSLENLNEFYLNIAFQMVFSSSALISAICMDLFFALCICHHGTASKLIEQSLCELNTMWTKNTHTQIIRKAKLINIIRQFQDLNSFAFKMNKTFSISLLVQPLIASAAIVISLFCVMVNFWIAGIGYIIFAYTQLISMCAVGQSVQNNNERLLRVLSESEWILFSILEQRLFLNILRSAQRAPEIWIGPWAPYNMQTASKITQKIYSFAMMMLRFTK